MDNPFEQASSNNKRLKLFVWGDSGVGKTTFALQFPSPVVIDLEGGTDLYGNAFKFDRIKTVDADEAMEAIDWLSTNKHNYKSVIIDPMTIYWEALQKKWSDIFLMRNRKSRGYRHEFYEFQIKDWPILKGELKEFIRKLIRLDMNVIVTGREKAKYKSEGKDMMVSDGETFDCEKSLPYLFDVILQITVNDKLQRVAKTIKDRSNKLPIGSWEFSYDLFAEHMGVDNLEREALPIELVTDEEVEYLNECLDHLGVKEEGIKRALAQYEVSSLSELTKEDGEKIKKILEKQLSEQSTKGDE